MADLAEYIADDYFPAKDIDPQALLKQKRITLSFGDYSDAFDGLLEHRAGRFHVYCNLARLSHDSRIRFTLAHELGHYFIPDHRQALEAGLPPHASFSEYQSDNPAEREADHFASNFLMPRIRFCREAKDRPAGLAAVLHLAQRFGTSWTSTTLRYVKLDLIPCAIIKWNSDGSSWPSFSESAYRAGFRKLTQTRTQVPPDSPTGKLFRGLSPDNSPFFNGFTVASQWFPFIPQGSYRDNLLVEQAISLGEFGFLTLIYPKSSSFEH